MKSFFILFSFFLFLIGCNNSSENVPVKIANKEVEELLENSKNKSFSLNERLAFINTIYAASNPNSFDSLTLAALFQKSNLHYDLNQKDSTFFFDKILLQKSLDINNTYYSAKAAKNLAFYFRDNKDIDSSYYYFNQSKYYFESLKDSTQVGRILLSMAQIQKNKSDFIGSKETITEAIQYLTSKKDNKYLASSYSILATNHKELLNNEDAIKYYQLAINTTKSKKDQLIYKNNLGAAFTRNKEYDKSINLLTGIKSDTILKSNSSQYARVLDNLTYAQWLNGKTEVLNDFLKALSIRIERNDKRGQIASYLHLGEYFSLSDKQQSNFYLNKAIQVSKQLNIPKGELEAIALLIQLSPKNITIKDRYIQLNDSLYRQELKAKTQFAKYKYDDAIKQQTISNLTLERELKTLEITKQKNQKIVAFLVTLLALISGSFLFYYLKQNHKKEKLQEIYETETRISQKVHDELANDVYNIMNRIENNTDLDKNLVIEKLQGVYQRTRNISYDNGTINLDNDYFHLELLELLNAYQDSDTTILIKGLNKTIWKDISNDKKIVSERVLKEMMTNMKKHSNASNVLIDFKKDLQNFYISYIDNGVGFKKTNHFKANSLQNVENRIKNINGTYNFDTTREKGVKIIFSFPV